MSTTDEGRRKISVRQIIAITLIVLVGIVILQNTETVETRILLARFSMPRYVLLIVTLMIGIAIGWLLAKRRGRRRG